MTYYELRALEPRLHVLEADVRRAGSVQAWWQPGGLRSRLSELVGLFRFPEGFISPPRADGPETVAQMIDRARAELAEVERVIQSMPADRARVERLLRSQQVYDVCHAHLVRLIGGPAGSEIGAAGGHRP